MARENKTKYAILGLLSCQSMSGYDIKKALEKSLGNFWSESYGQIYPVMKHLTEEGLATKAIEKQEGKPDRHVYSITEQGLEMLQKWLPEPAEPPKERVEVLLKLFFGKNVPLSVNIKHLERTREENTALLKYYLEIKDVICDEYKDNPNLSYWLMTLRCGIQCSKSLIEWCDEEIATLKRIEDK